LIFSSVDYSPITYAGIKYPQWGENIGWCIALSSLIAIPILAMIEYCKASGHSKVGGGQISSAVKIA